MLVLYYAVTKQKGHVAKFIEKGFSKDDAKDLALGYFNLVKEMAGEFMALTSFCGRLSLMDWLLRLRTYGIKIRFNTNADGVI